MHTHTHRLPHPTSANRRITRRTSSLSTKTVADPVFLPSTKSSAGGRTTTPGSRNTSAGGRATAARSARGATGTRIASSAAAAQRRRRRRRRRTARNVENVSLIKIVLSVGLHRTHIDESQTEKKEDRHKSKPKHVLEEILTKRSANNGYGACWYGVRSQKTHYPRKTHDTEAQHNRDSTCAEGNTQSIHTRKTHDTEAQQTPHPSES